MEAHEQSLEKATDPEGPDAGTDEHEAIEKPAELLRLAHMVQSTLNEVRAMEIDEGGRERLSEVYNRTVTELRELISEDLQDELDDIAVTPLEDSPSSGELRIAQAQLVGWLQGLFQGLQASMASRQLAGQQSQRPSGGPPAGGGQYL